MKNTASNPITKLMNEYIVWGGPVVTRAEALLDAQARGLSARCIDVSIFGRNAVAAPADPAAEVAFLVRIQEMDGLTLAAA